MSAAEPTDPKRNFILNSLPAEEYDKFLAAATYVDLELRDTLFDANQVIDAVYFPLGGIVSFVALADGEVIVEVGTIGREGMVGLHAFLGSPTSPQAAFCQVPGAAMRLPIRDLHSLLNGDGALHHALNRFTQATISQLAQNVACNRTHTTEARAARWLLMTHDRVGVDTFPLTHSFLAQMLGVRRPTVSLTAGVLQSAGLIEYSRGIITIRDRAGLEAASCDCYRIIREEFDRLAGLQS